MQAYDAVSTAMRAASISCFQGWLSDKKLESVHAYRHETKEKKTPQNAEGTKGGLSLEALP